MAIGLAAMAALVVTGVLSFGSPDSSAAAGQRLFAVDGASGTASTLYELDAGTGAVLAVIGATGYSHIASIDFDPTSGILYGIVNGSPSTLVTIDLTTGVATPVAPLTWSDGSCADQVPDMAFNSSGDLYVWREPCADDTYRVDKVTGVATLVGESGLSTAEVGLAFDSSDTLYMKNFDGVHVISTTTGVSLSFVSFGCCPTSNLLTFNDSDVAYTATRGGGSPLMTLDVTTGALTVVGPTGIARLSAIAFERVGNADPDCSAAAPSVAEIWPPNHAMTAVSVTGVTDPDGNPITIAIDAIFQDEPVNGTGDGDTAPDGSGIGSSTAQVRAERSGGGNGRVYEISFTATDGNGGSCSGVVSVGVRHSQGKNSGPAVNDGAVYDSTVG